MNAKPNPSSGVKPAQEVCIDLPGESVQCWRSSDNIKVILRKHRDVFFDINLHSGTVYVIESQHEFYSAKDKKLLKRATFRDGERFHVWVGREFNGKLILKTGSKTLSTFEPNKFDTKKYNSDPKTKPEPLMVILGKKEVSSPLICRPDDRFGMAKGQSLFQPIFDPKMSFLKAYGTDFDYKHVQQQPEIQDYACVTEALEAEIKPEIVGKLGKTGSAEGAISELFLPPQPNTQKSYLYTAMAWAFGAISGNETITSNLFKETAGYFQEHWRQMDKIRMTAKIERKVNGKYRVIFRGKPFNLSQLKRSTPAAKVIHKRVPLGSSTSAFIDGGFARTGKNGYGGMKRIMLTNAENFKGGMKIQIIGTIIDLIGDANAVYFDEKGSKDLTEFLGRAGVSIAKAGATAALGSALAGAGVLLATAAMGVATLPVWVAVGVIVGGYVLAATIVDMIDDGFSIKKTVAEWTK